MGIFALPLLVCLVGLLIYALSKNGDVKEIGRIMFAFGLLVVLLGSGSEMVRLFGK
jgi:Na+/phosphate symporter